MSFGLKNVRVTYQRATTTLLHYMMHQDVEIYVNDMIVKSRDKANHLAAFERFLWKDQTETEPQEVHLWSDF